MKSTRKLITRLAAVTLAGSTAIGTGVMTQAAPIKQTVNITIKTDANGNSCITIKPGKPTSPNIPDNNIEVEEGPDDTFGGFDEDLDFEVEADVEIDEDFGGFDEDLDFEVDTETEDTEVEEGPDDTFGGFDDDLDFEVDTETEDTEVEEGPDDTFGGFDDDLDFEVDTETEDTEEGPDDTFGGFDDDLDFEVDTETEDTEVEEGPDDTFGGFDDDLDFEVDVEQGTTLPDNEDDKEQDNEEEASVQTQFENRVLELVNVERKRYNLSLLTMNEGARTVARLKSTDMQQNDYFSHTSPTYGTAFDMLKSEGIAYNTAGENIAMGQRTPEDVVTAWMNSEGHRKNILNASFTSIGVGYEEKGHYWTQVFIG